LECIRESLIALDGEVMLFSGSCIASNMQKKKRTARVCKTSLKIAKAQYRTKQQGTT
jgi:hypothetical protein